MADDLFISIAAALGIPTNFDAITIPYLVLGPDLEH
jgi:hypothetical protein